MKSLKRLWIKRLQKEKHNRSWRISVLLLLSVTVLSFPDTLFAQTNIALEVALGTTKQTSGFSNYLAIAYEMIVGIVALLSAASIMLNGVRWVAAGGNSEQIGKAKDGIKGAIAALVIALLSYTLLYTLNPNLTVLNNIIPQAPNLKPATPVSIEAINSGNRCDDSNLVKYMEVLPPELQPYLTDSAPEPCIQSTTYQYLLRALRELKDNPEYQGMRIHISSANRNLDDQELFWACYQYTVEKKPCPASCSRSNCNEAAEPGYSSHGSGIAIDIAWQSIDSRAKYVSTQGYASSSWHNTCLVKKTKDDKNCPPAVVQSVIALDTMMQSVGFSRYCGEWWHFQSADGQTLVCSAGVYTNSE